MSEVERFQDHPTPDRFFQQIGQAEIEMRVTESDDVSFRTNVVPGGTFCVELSASYTYAGYDCKQHVSLTREAAKDLHDRLEAVLDEDPRQDRGGDL
jgi:hypothetical protein